MRYLPLVVLMTTSFGASAQGTEADQFVLTILATALPRELKDSLEQKDFSTLWTRTPNWVVRGFIGDDYQRLRTKVLSVIKAPTDPALYHVYGKDMVKTNVCQFQGELRVTNVRRYIDEYYNDLDDVYRDSVRGRFLVCGNYSLFEDPTQKHVGIFSGTFASYFYIDRNGSVRYDDINDDADGSTNNQFVGDWTSYDGRLHKRCNWGDGRIPNSRDFDMGAGEFSPAEEYRANGWENIRLTYELGPEGDKARAAERVEWWK